MGHKMTLPRFLARLICRWHGHKWGRAYLLLIAATEGVPGTREVWNKACRRCGVTAPVKRRVKKEAA
jgi:hypothetical protein